MISRDKKEKKETRTLTDESVSFFFRSSLAEGEERREHNYAGKID